MDFSQLNPFDMYGVNPGSPGPNANGGGLEQLPGSSAMYGDGSQVPWNPDSPLFWFGCLAALTLFGILGASLDVRAGHKHASVKIGND